MVKDIICVACPMGCQISVELNDDGEILSVTGNTCKRGDAYALSLIHISPPDFRI